MGQRHWGNNKVRRDHGTGEKGRKCMRITVVPHGARSGYTATAFDVGNRLHPRNLHQMARPERKGRTLKGHSRWERSNFKVLIYSTSSST